MRKITFLFLLIGVVFKFHTQELTSGVVSDEFGVLEGANVFIKNSKKGAVSNSEGYFEINAKKGDTVSVSFMGYKTKEVVITSPKSIDVILGANILLDEIIVNACGTTSRRCVICCGFSLTNISYYDFKSDKKSLKLYPNPSSNGLFKLNLLKDYQKVEIQVSNITGQLINHSSYQHVNKKVNIDLSEFPTGIYLINILADGKRLETKKAVKS